MSSRLKCSNPHPAAPHAHLRERSNDAHRSGCAEQAVRILFALLGVHRGVDVELPTYVGELGEDMGLSERWFAAISYF